MLELVIGTLNWVTLRLLDEFERSLHDILVVLSQIIKKPRTALNKDYTYLRRCRTSLGTYAGKPSIPVGRFFWFLGGNPARPNSALTTKQFLMVLKPHAQHNIPTVDIVSRPAVGRGDMQTL
jgi:hypothetical protein